ncbi:MAG TPA: hypothetical protein VMC61_02340 [Methanocella sp.]|nr:hypothetical protein [Methanocella sp.]
MMNQWMEYMEDDPRRHTSKIKKELSDLVEHLREDERKVDDPKARALFETTAEVLSGLKKAYEDYENRAPAWK